MPKCSHMTKNIEASYKRQTKHPKTFREVADVQKQYKIRNIKTPTLGSIRDIKVLNLHDSALLVHLSLLCGCTGICFVLYRWPQVFIFAHEYFVRDGSSNFGSWSRSIICYTTSKAPPRLPPWQPMQLADPRRTCRPDVHVHLEIYNFL